MKFIISHVTILIFISCKRTKVAEIILKTDVNNDKCDNMGNSKKTVFHMP